MNLKSFALAASASTLFFALPAQAQTEIQWWHSMSGQLGEWVNGLAKGFNDSQKDYKVVPVFKGTYPESFAAAIAAFRAGNAPHILQVFEVGTASMMASKGAIIPVTEVMKTGGVKFDPSVYVPAVAGYYTAPNGQMLSLPFNSSTTVFHYNKDAFKAAGLDPDKPPTTWPEVALAAAKLKISGHKCPFTTSWQSWTQLESFSAWHNVEFATKRNGFNGLDTRLAFNTPLHVRHIENLANMAQQGLFVYKGRNNTARRRCTVRSSATPSSPAASAPCPTTPTSPARRRTPSSVAPASGPCPARSRPRSRAWRCSSSTCPTRRCRPRATRKPATCRSPPRLTTSPRSRASTSRTPAPTSASTR